MQSRLRIFDELSTKYEIELAYEFTYKQDDGICPEANHFVQAKPRDKISITLPDGTVKDGNSWETTPANIAKSISKSILERTVVARVNGELWDLDRPFEYSCQLELLDYEIPKVLALIHPASKDGV